MFSNTFLFIFILENVYSTDSIIRGAPTNEVTRHLSAPATEQKHIPIKYACPAEQPPTLDELDFSDCKKMMKEGLQSYHPDQYKLTGQLLETHGYPYTKYRVRTSDGYILSVYRITGSPNLQKNQTHKTPIYINHGLIGSSDWWFFLPPEKTLVFMMADEGYDVWLSNARGSTYSLEHDTLDHNTNILYWDFSFHEMGVYDVPAVINTMLEVTGHRDVLYLGYSMGAVELLICLSEMPEMNDKIKAVFLFAPVAHMGHATILLRHVAAFTDTEEEYHVVNIASNGRFRSNQEFRKVFNTSSAELCTLTAAKCGVCDNFVFAALGINPLQLNRSALPLFAARFPNSVSVKTLAHFAQLVTSCRFQKFKYSPTINLDRYGSFQPPEYDMSKVRSPIYIYYGENDICGPPVDVFKTVKRLRPGVVKKLVLIEDKMFTHLDFCMAKDADKLVYKGLLKDMRKYKRKT